MDTQKAKERGRARGHSFPPFQFQGSSKAPVYISQWYLRMVVRAALEMCKSNSLTQRFIRPSVCSRVHALTRAHAEERRGRRVSLPIYDSDVVSCFFEKLHFSFIPQYRGHVYRCRAKGTIIPESRSYTINRVIWQVVNKFSKLLPLPRRNTVSTAIATGVMPTRASMHPSCITFPPPCPSLFVVVHDARGNLLLKTASSAKREVYEAM